MKVSDVVRSLILDNFIIYVVNIFITIILLLSVPLLLTFFFPKSHPYFHVFLGVRAGPV